MLSQRYFGGCSRIIHMDLVSIHRWILSTDGRCVLKLVFKWACWIYWPEKIPACIFSTPIGIVEDHCWTADMTGTWENWRSLSEDKDFFWCFVKKGFSSQEKHFPDGTVLSESVVTQICFTSVSLEFGS